MDRDHDAENNTERERLISLIARLSDDDLARPMPAGWTVAAVLAHIGFWDARAIFLLDKWQTVQPSKADWEPEDIQWINDAAKPLCLALPPRAAPSWPNAWPRKQMRGSWQSTTSCWRRSSPLRAHSTCHGPLTGVSTSMISKRR